MQKILAIDYGTKRIGIAISDTLGMYAHPRPFLPYSKTLKQNILQLCADENIAQILIGIPTRLNGEQSIFEQDIRTFIAQLQSLTDIPIETWDERLTSAQAQKAMIAADVKRKKRKQAIDSMAASLLLQNYLDAQKNLSLDSLTLDPI